MAISRIIAGCLSLSGFAVALIAGMAAGNGPSLVLTRALIAMVVCYPVGFIMGIMCDRVIQWHVAAHAEAHPVPEGEDAASVAAAGAAEGAAEDEEVITV